MKSGITKGIALLLLALFTTISAAEKSVLLLPSIFSNHMVIQRDEKIPVWGWGKAGDEVEVTFAGNKAQTKVGDDGKWLVHLPAMKAGGPYTMTVKSGGKEITLNDVLMGDVWLCSGQSNMEWGLSSTTGSKEERASANLPQLRHIKVQRNPSFKPLDNFKGSWQVCTPKTAGSFTAVGYYFGKELNQKLNVPIGLLNSSWGGTSVQPWTSLEVSEKIPANKGLLKARLEQMKLLSSANKEELAAKIKAYKESKTKIAAIEKDSKRQAKYSDPKFDDSKWKFINTPSIWQKQGYPKSQGVAWYRKTVEIPADWAGKDLFLSPGAVDEIETTFYNGHKIGSTGSYKPFDTSEWNNPRVYVVPGEYVKAGKAVIAVRVINVVGGGGMFSNGNAMDMYLQPVNICTKPIALSGKWRFSFTYKVPKRYTDRPSQRVVSTLFNGMIHPILQFPIKGAIWYQGESNAGNAYNYRILFPAMIKQWRKDWGKEFPFYWVQLANYRAPKKSPKADSWAVVRESQNEALKLPNTGTAVIIDIGEEKDIHPRNKRDVGKRLSLIARANTYGEKDLPYSGPMYKSMKVEGNKIRIFFDHVNGGLVARGGELKRFAIAGADKKFYWAKAVIDGDSVVVSSKNVLSPVAVRYAFEINPKGCNLYNKAGLPASPFRTDDWKVPTQK